MSGADPSPECQRGGSRGAPRPIARRKTNRRERDQRQREPDAARERPTTLGVGPGPDRRAERAGQEEGRDIDSVEPAARFRRKREDGAKAQDDIRLNSEVDRDRSDDENRKRSRRALPCHCGQKRKGDEDDRGPSRQPAEAAIGEPPGERRGDRAGNAGQCEERDAPLRQPIVGAGEQQRRRRPEQAEGGEQA